MAFLVEAGHQKRRYASADFWGIQAWHAESLPVGLGGYWKTDTVTWSVAIR